MGTKERSDIPESTSLLLAEYNALRNEILKRMDVENQLATFTVIVFGTILGIGLQNKSAVLILLYPTLATFFAIGWSHSNYMIFQIGTYLKQHVESVVGVDKMGWEHYRTMKSLYVWSARGIFLTTEVLAIAVGLSLIPLSTTFLTLPLRQVIMSPDFTVNILLCIAFVSLFLTFFILRQTPKDHIQVPSKLIKLHTDKE